MSGVVFAHVWGQSAQRCETESFSGWSSRLTLLLISHRWQEQQLIDYCHSGVMQTALSQCSPGPIPNMLLKNVFLSFVFKLVSIVFPVREKKVKHIWLMIQLCLIRVDSTPLSLPRLAAQFSSACFLMRDKWIFDCSFDYSNCLCWVWFCFLLAIRSSRGSNLSFNFSVHCPRFMTDDVLNWRHSHWVWFHFVFSAELQSEDSRCWLSYSHYKQQFRPYNEILALQISLTKSE